MDSSKTYVLVETEIVITSILTKPIRECQVCNFTKN